MLLHDLNLAFSFSLLYTKYEKIYLIKCICFSLPAIYKKFSMLQFLSRKYSIIIIFCLFISALSTKCKTFLVEVILYLQMNISHIHQRNLKIVIYLLLIKSQRVKISFIYFANNH